MNVEPAYGRQVSKYFVFHFDIRLFSPHIFTQKLIAKDTNT